MRGNRRAVLALLLIVATVGSMTALAAQTLPGAPSVTPAVESPGVLKSIVPNGLRLLAKPNPSSDIVAIDCLVRVGLREEPEESAGIAALLGEVVIRGTERHAAA